MKIDFISEDTIKRKASEHANELKTTFDKNTTGEGMNPVEKLIAENSYAAGATEIQNMLKKQILRRNI